MELPVEIKHIIFPRLQDINGPKDTGFRILSAVLDIYNPKYTPSMEDLVKDCIDKKYNTFVITIGMMDPNENPYGGQYVFIGDFINDKKFGKQFKADFYYQDSPTTEEGLKAFLMFLPNIKEARSTAIIEKFGVEGTVQILDNDISRLMEIAGINEKRIPPIQKAWEEKKCLRELYGFFVKVGLPVTFADKIYKQWGKDSKKIMSNTPYRLAEIRGIGFITADKIAHGINPKICEKDRVTACIYYILEDCLYKQSNLCITYGNLKKSLISILSECDRNLGKNIDAQSYLKIIPECLKSNLDIFTLVKDIETAETYIYIAKIWEREYYIAKSLWDRKMFNHAAKECSDNDIAGEEYKLEMFTGKKIVLDESQKNAIKSAFEHKISVITGPGGSGKSMLCRCICSLAHKKGLKVRLMSPTGKAAQVLSEKTGCEASTIHRGLKMTPDEEFPRSSITEDILLVDEISMSGIDTMFAIVAAMEDNLWGNIVFVGDKNQIPSISPGNFLSDIIDSGCANVITLDKIHRTDEKSYISILANDISKGKVVEIPKDAIDIRWHEIQINTFHQDLLNFVDGYLNSGNDIEDLQIISPMKKGVCGVFKINEIMQKKMVSINGTADDFIQIGFNKFHVGDRVIQTVNNYDKNIFNGDMGIVKDVGDKMVDPTVSDRKEKFITVEFYGEDIIYWGTEIEQLMLGWCLTVHKMQGSSAKHVIFIMANEAQILISKEMAYTALTRPEKQLDIFGHENMLRLAPTRSVIRKRFTNTKRIIEELRTNKKLLQVLKKEK